MKEVQELPMMGTKHANNEVTKKEIERLDEATKKYPETEKMMMEEMKEMYVREMISATEWNKMVEVFRSRSSS